MLRAISLAVPRGYRMMNALYRSHRSGYGITSTCFATKKAYRMISARHHAMIRGFTKKSVCTCTTRPSLVTPTAARKACPGILPTTSIHGGALG
eukprot:scaffold14_cov380-Prasinococcus_capsulatus_cf.AAC.7